MDVREKFVELLMEFPLAYDVCDKQEKKECGDTPCCECLANHLIAHGVTVQEWISVNDERKPKHGEDVLVVVFDGYDTYTDTDCLMRNGKWCYETENHKVTHWQPMPQPPKGE